MLALPLTSLHAANVVAQAVFDVALWRAFGGNALAYLILSSFLAGSLHPCAGHFIAEHYVLGRLALAQRRKEGKGKEEVGARDVPVPETFSYYGPLNALTYNVGLHNEHHDFPAVPWSRLPAVHALAREFYDELPSHGSWVGVLWQFVWDKEVGLWCRVKRKEGGRKVGGWKTEELGNAVEGEVKGVR